MIYSDSNKVYFYQYNQFNLLYDFNANQGDTIFVKEPFIISCGGNGDTLIPFLVDSVKTENIGGVMKKVQYVTNTESGWTFGDKFIEDVGSNYYFFPTDCVAPPVIDSLRCYNDSLISYNLVIDCTRLNMITGLIDNPTNLNIKLPSIAYNQIKLPIINVQILIYDLQGRIVKNERATDVVNLNNLEKGMYILIIKTDNSIIKHKFIKL